MKDVINILQYSNLCTSREWHNDEAIDFLSLHMQLVCAAIGNNPFIHRLPFAYSKNTKTTTIYFMNSRSYDT